MIISVCSDKGAPGVTTTATALGIVWPGERLLLEADPSGGDLALRMRTAQGQLLARQPAVRALAVDARSGAVVESLTSYAHQTSLGVPVIPATATRSPSIAAAAYAAATPRWPSDR